MPTIDYRVMAEQAAGTDQATGIERVRRIVAWMYRAFELLPTDYQERTVDEIVERGGGNCREHALVWRGCSASWTCRSTG